MEARLRPRDVDAASRAIAQSTPDVEALALTVLSRQGESQLLFAGKEFVRARAEEHGVSPDSEIGGERVVAILERGPSSPKEFALVCALAVKGLRAHVDDGERMKRFVRHADWLTFSTPYAPYEFVDALLGDDARAVWEALAGDMPEGSPRDAAVRALHEAVLREHASDLLAPSETSETVQTEGELVRPPATGTGGVVRLVSGWALLQWVVRTLAWAVGVRRRGTLSFVGGGVRLTRETRMLGRVARQGTETFTLPAIASAGRSTRFPTTHLLVGAVSLAIGVLVGGLFLFDGIRSGETVLLLIGAGLVLAGGGLDLALSVLVPGSKGEITLNLAVLPKRRVHLRGMSEEDAEAFLRELRFRKDGR
ncbi:MAG: hypothetical protein AAGE52_22400 [Myxococcota bacterium]